MPERLLSRELVRREQDALWRLVYTPPEEPEAEEAKAKETEADWFYFYLHLEHKSHPKTLMALDVAAYKLLIWQDLARRKELTTSRKLPPILSVVFHTGARKWRAATSLDELIQKVPDPPEGLGVWDYRLIDVQRHGLEKLVGSDSPLLGLFRLEQLDSLDDLAGTARELKGVLGPEDEELSDAFVALINEVVFPKLTLPGDRRLWITDLEEVPSMLAQRIERITDRWEMKGWEKGQVEGRIEVFLELFAAKFGDAPTQVRERATGVSKKQLGTWTKQLLWAERPEDVFDD